MIGYLRVKSPWSQLAIFLGLLGAAFFLASLVMALLFMSSGIPLARIKDMNLDEPRVLSAMKLIQGISAVIIFLFPAIAFALIVFNRKPLEFLGFKRARTVKMYAMAVVIILVAFPLVFWLGELNQGLPLPKWVTGMEAEAAKQMQAFLKVTGPMDIVVNVFLIALVPAFCEEVCFRGTLQRILIHVSRSPWVGIIITSIIFSALHLQFQGFLPRMLLGVLLGALYWYSGSIWTSILAHFVNNAVQVVAVSYAPGIATKDPSIPFIAALISAIAVLAVIWLYKSFSTVTYEKVYEPDDLNKFNQFIA